MTHECMPWTPTPSHHHPHAPWCAHQLAFSLKGGFTEMVNGAAMFTAAQLIARHHQAFGLGVTCNAPKIGPIPLRNPSRVVVQVSRGSPFMHPTTHPTTRPTALHNR